MVANDKKRLKPTNTAMLISHGFNNVVSIFVSTFLVSYIYSLSNNYMMNIGLFYFMQYASMFIFYTIISMVIDKTDRVTFYRISLFVKGIFILSVVLLGKNLAKLVSLAGLLYGFAEACYWSSYNLMKNELVSHHAMEKYSLIQFFDTKVINIVIPLILGKVIDGESFKLCAIIVLISVAVQTVVSFFIKSKRPENSSFDFKSFVKQTKSLEPKKRNAVVLSLIIGVVYGIGAVVSPLTTILIMTSFGSNFSLGVLSSLFAVASLLLLLAYKKWTKLGKRCGIYFVSAVLPIIAALLICFSLNKTTVVLYVLFYTIAIVLYEFGFDVTRNLILKKLDMYDSIAEYQCAVEGSLQIGRMIVFGIMAIFGLISAGWTMHGLQVGVMIFCAVAILIISILNVLLAIYEKRFLKHVMTKE
jgi:MFS family permease